MVGEVDYLVTTTFRVTAQSAEAAVNDVRAHLRALDGDLLGCLSDRWIVLNAHRIRSLDDEEGSDEPSLS